jgi:hypothetical protein
MNVYDDAEPPFDDGDWRFYFNTNNRDQEWTELYSCDGCVDDDTTYQLNATTGVAGGGNGSKPSKARNMGPDPVVFPGQSILVHTMGYDDEVVGDPAGSVVDHRPQLSDDYSTNSANGDGSYKLNYSIRPVGTVGRATLTPEAAALLRAYTGSTGVQCRPNVLGRALAPGRLPSECTADPKDSTFAKKSVVQLKGLRDFEVEGHEVSEHALTGISAATLRRQFKTLRRGDRRQLLNNIRHELGTAPKIIQGDYSELFGTFDKALPAKVVRRAVPKSVRKRVSRVRRKRARQRRLAQRRRHARRHHRRR